MKAVFIGSVLSSNVILEELLNSEIEVSMVFSLDEKYSENVSGYYPIHTTAERYNVPYKKFRKINEAENIDLISKIAPDFIFVIGLSQLVDKKIISIPRKGVIGFHPTPLPKFRGRAAMVWQVLLDVRETKCTMFFIDEGMDSGDIIAQEDYYIGENDYACDVERNLMAALPSLTCKAIEKITKDNIEVIKQNEEEAIYLLKRSLEDGIIDWNLPIKDIHKLIRAVSKPYPGAFSYYDGTEKIIIWRAEMMENKKYIGFPGQIAKIDENGIYVVCVDGLLHITEFDFLNNKKIFVGHKFKNLEVRL